MKNILFIFVLFCSFSINARETYIQKDIISFFDGEKMVEDTSISTIEIDLKKSVFDISIVGGSAHTCVMKGKLIYVTDTLYQAIEILEDKKICVLNFIFKDKTITLVDTEMNCKSAHCGIQASMSGKFTKK